MKNSNPFGDDDDGRVKQIAAESIVNGSNTDEIDPLDAFMDQLEDEEPPDAKRARVGIPYEVEDEETPEEMMERIIKKRHITEVRSSGLSDDESGSHAKRSIDNLPPIDHSTITYSPFRKDFHNEHPAISALTSSDVAALRKSLGVSVTGSQIPKCVCAFAHLNLPEAILSVLRYLEFSTPTPIQTQSIPCALSGRNVLGLAMTGSGKTMSYVIPALMHVLGNERTGLPRVAIVCPTRELAIQIEQEIYRFVKKSGDLFSSLALTGGLSKYEQFKQIAKGCDIIVGNPGRMIDLLQMKKGLDLKGVTMCILDEADRMFKMGFENQLRVIVQRIRPDRQLLMFSATMPPKIEKLAREIMEDPIRIVVGSIGQAASVINQNVFVYHSDDEKYVWLTATLSSIVSGGGRVMLFVNSKSAGEELTRRVKMIVPVAAQAIHGDLDQTGRMRIMNDFRSGKCPILVATDVAARGLDVEGVTCVVEFDAARDFDTHTHRIGRTGRAGMVGTSWTLLGQHEAKLAAHILESMETLGLSHSIHEELTNLAMKHGPFKAARTLLQKEKPEKVEDVAAWEPLEQHFRKGKSEQLD